MTGTIVIAPVATLWKRPEASATKDRLTQLHQGEPVLVEEIQDGWARVVATAQPADKLDQRGYPGWLKLDQLSTHVSYDDTGALALELARSFIGVPYLWGGMTPAGIDCSGLVHLSFRRVGVLLPRDADDQFHATEPITRDEARPGDLYFFGYPGKLIHHVAFAVGEGGILHACGDARVVIEEPMPASRQDSLVSVHRVG